MSKKYFITSDVHSFFDELMVALNEKGFDRDNNDHILCICGDLYDRGAKPRELFEFVKELQGKDRLIYILGNHEELLFDCMREIRRGQVPSAHHFHNRTVETICRFCGQNEWIMYDPTWRGKICEIMQPVLDFISDNCFDYAEIGNHVLVHGWIPVTINDSLPHHYTNNRRFEFNPNWRNATDEEWSQARWLNGMDMWKYVGHPDDVVVVVGHWHCSYGWSHIDQKYKEFPDKLHKHFRYSFEPWINDGIVALDACCAYSGKLNCIVIEI